jgi:hypothetical protein
MDKEALVSWVASLEKWRIFVGMIAVTLGFATGVIQLCHWWFKRDLTAIEAKEKAALADRSLTKDQIAALIELVRPFAGQTINFLCVSEPEPMHIGQQVAQSVLDAGWSVGLTAGSENAKTVSGMRAEVPPGADEKSAASAKALVDALVGAGLVAVGPAPPQSAGYFSILPTGSTIPGTQINMLVGRK